MKFTNTQIGTVLKSLLISAVFPFLISACSTQLRVPKIYTWDKTHTCFILSVQSLIIQMFMYTGFVLMR